MVVTEGLFNYFHDGDASYMRKRKKKKIKGESKTCEIIANFVVNWSTNF